MRQLGNPQQAGLLQGQVPSSVMNPGPGYQNPMLRQGFANAAGGLMVGQEVMPGGMGPDGKQHLVRTALMNNNKRFVYYSMFLCLLRCLNSKQLLRL